MHGRILLINGWIGRETYRNTNHPTQLLVVAIANTYNTGNSIALYTRGRIIIIVIVATQHKVKTQ